MNSPSSPIAPEHEVLDWDALCDRCLGRTDLVEKVLRRFRESMGAELRKLERSIDEQDLEEIARNAHRIKGTALTVSADRLAKCAKTLEGIAKCDAAGIQQGLEDLRHEVRLVAQYIDGRCSGGKE